MTITSAAGVGTTVTLLLPRSRKTSAGGEESGNVARLADGGARDDRRRHVLLVEDDHEVATLTREQLTSLGFSVSHFASPDAALRIVMQPHDIDIVVTDLMMPGLVNGLQAGAGNQDAPTWLADSHDDGERVDARGHGAGRVSAPAQAVWR